MTNPKSTVTLISGGTGSLGSALVFRLLQTTSNRIRVYDRSEAKLLAMQARLGPQPRLTYIMGDVRDLDRLTWACRGVDEIYATAALKVVGMGELYSTEFRKTNIDGAYNTTVAAGINNVPKSLFISSDKGCEPVNLYGQTKAIGESIFREANLIWNLSKFSSIRGGNIWKSRGSVVNVWLDSKFIQVSDPLTTRFHLRMETWLTNCIQAMNNLHGGEIFVPACPAWNLRDLQTAMKHLYPDFYVPKDSGLRDGDKLHETLISLNELPNAKVINVQDWLAYVIEPGKEIRSVWNYQEWDGYRLIDVGGSEPVTSDRANRLSVKELEDEINA
jgi:FlaA1/EpsC-like NDP-sugar epimerase